MKYTHENTSWRFKEPIKPFLFALIKDKESLLLRPIVYMSDAVRFIVKPEDVSSLIFDNVISYVPTANIKNLKGHAKILEKDMLFFNEVFNENIIHYMSGILYYVQYLQWLRFNVLNQKTLDDAIKLQDTYIECLHHSLFRFLQEDGVELYELMSKASLFIKEVSYQSGILPYFMLDNIESSFEDYIAEMDSEDMMKEEEITLDLDVWNI